MDVTGRAGVVYEPLAVRTLDVRMSDRRISEAGVCILLMLVLPFVGAGLGESQSCCPLATDLVPVDNARLSDDAPEPLISTWRGLSNTS